MVSNPRKVLELVRAAAPDRPDLILLPENGLMIGTNDEMRAAALAIDSPEIDELRRAAQEVAATVILGGFKHRDSGSTVRNTALLIGPKGEIAGSYDKIYLFDATRRSAPAMRSRPGVTHSRSIRGEKCWPISATHNSLRRHSNSIQREWKKCAEACQSCEACVPKHTGPNRAWSRSARNPPLPACNKAVS